MIYSGFFWNDLVSLRSADYAVVWHRWNPPPYTQTEESGSRAVLG